MEHVTATMFGEVVKNYESTCEKLDNKFTELEKQLVDLNKAIRAGHKLFSLTGNDKLNLKALIGVFASHEGEVDIVLIYGMYLLFFILALSLPLLSHQQCNVEWLSFMHADKGGAYYGDIQGDITQSTREAYSMSKQILLDVDRHS